VQGRPAGGWAGSWRETGDRVSAGPSDVVCRAAACRQRGSVRLGSDDPVVHGSQLCYPHSDDPHSDTGSLLLRSAPSVGSVHVNRTVGRVSVGGLYPEMSHDRRAAARQPKGLAQQCLGHVRRLLPTHEPSAERMANIAMSSSMGASVIRQSQSGSMRWCAASVARATRASRSSVRTLPRCSIRPSV
jgi:hypothetical protein